MPIAPCASLVVYAGIIGLALAVATGICAMVYRASPKEARRFAVIVAGWASLTLCLALAGVFARVDLRPPPLLLILVGLAIGVPLLARSNIGAALASTSPWILVGLQSFRLPLELVMHQAAQEGTMPMQMTFGAGGLNYDIVTGATAVVLASIMRRRDVPRVLVLAWNVLGSVLLSIVVVVAVASLPIFAAFGTDAAALNTWVLFAPFVWLPALLVGSAALGHIVLFRALIAPPARSK
ncbi:MAG: hypothetical protein H7Z43_13185 [Clostridia bacterium]|nr:hypothetical protein [Deltaproteobacteria bacterium]